MLTSNNDARKMWCPFARVGVRAGDTGVAVNRHSTDHQGINGLVYPITRCQAESCAVWDQVREGFGKCSMKGGEDRGG